MDAKRRIGYKAAPMRSHAPVVACLLPWIAWAGPIQDNSFLIEEAYNQEVRVVQHILTWSRDHDTRAWEASFTQEWPFRGQRHQLSVTVPYPDGIGDVLLNWRIQAVGSGETPVAFSPRLSLVLPTGDERNGRGTGSLGIQGNLPLSVVLAPRFVTHVNLGATFAPSAENELGEKADLSEWTFGQSFVWLAAERFNVMLEALYTNGEAIVGPDATERVSSLTLNPGIRWAHDSRRGLQIVPGIAVPIGIGPSRGERGIFLYLSFEHPF